MITSIKRLYEADDIQQVPMHGQVAQPQQAPQPAHMMPPPAPVEAPSEMMPDFSFQDEPEQGQEALPQADVMNLTVNELIERCNKINPLICMGLQQFIETNKDEILNMTTGEAPAEHGEEEIEGDEDINFSKQMEPKSPEFNLDQPEADLDFPQE